MATDMNRQELEEMLSNPPMLKDKKIYIWGTGNTASLYQESLIRLEQEGSLAIAGYVDNNSAKWGGLFGGKPVISPQEFSKLPSKCALICSPQKQVVQAIQQQLQGLSAEGYHIDEVILKSHKDKLLQCLDLLEDTESKETYSHIIACRLANEYPLDQFISTGQYFQPREFYQRNPNEVFIDCGAFVGDTIERYVWKKDGVFRKAIGFEPDPDNYRAMEARINRLKKEWNVPASAFEIYPYGLSDKSAYSKIEKDAANNGLGSKIVGLSSFPSSDAPDKAPKGSGSSETRSEEENCRGLTDSNCQEHNAGEECRIVSIDDFIEEPYTFLKADIESYEYKLLLGARNSIVKWHPLLAICIYHSAADLYDIPLLLHSIEPSYKMKIRHYSNFLDETVLYAWVE